MSYRTYKQWKKKGRQVIQGETAVGRLTDGTCLFSKKQTKKIKNKILPTEQSDYYTGNPDDWDYDQEYGYNIGLPGQW
jgi:hypothetical protein